MLIAVPCALAAALLYALASVWQQRAAAAQPADKSLRLGLLARLARNRMWLLGITADVAGYVGQFVALDRGTLVLVQPLLVSGLLFALPLGAYLAGSRLSGRDWVAALSVCAGLSVFLVIAGSASGHHAPTSGVWAILLVVAAAVCGVLIVGARRRPANQRAAMLSAAAGVIYGVSAGFTKTAAGILGHGVVALITSWQVWGLAVTAIAGLLVAQSAFQSGSLEASLPAMAVLDPIVSILIGVTAFGENLPSGAAATFGQVASLLLMTAGIFGLARSNAIQVIHGSPVP